MEYKVDSYYKSRKYGNMIKIIDESKLMYSYIAIYDDFSLSKKVFDATKDKNPLDQEDFFEIDIEKEKSRISSVGSINSYLVFDKSIDAKTFFKNAIRDYCEKNNVPGVFIFDDFPSAENKKGNNENLKIFSMELVYSINEFLDYESPKFNSIQKIHF